MTDHHADISSSPGRVTVRLVRCPPELMEALRADPTKEPVRAFYQALSNPEKHDFNRAYGVFCEVFYRRRGQGWTTGDWGNASQQMVNRLTLVDGAHQRWPYSKRRTEVQLEQLRGRADEVRRRDPPPPDQGQFPAWNERSGMREVQAQIAERERILGSSFGQCGDWSMEIRDAIEDIDPPLIHFRPGKEERTDASHESAYVERVAAPPPSADPLLLATPPMRAPGKQRVVFDPWQTGRPDVYAWGRWFC